MASSRHTLRTSTQQDIHRQFVKTAGHGYDSSWTSGLGWLQNQQHTVHTAMAGDSRQARSTQSHSSQAPGPGATEAPLQSAHCCTACCSATCERERRDHSKTALMRSQMLHCWTTHG